MENSNNSGKVVASLLIGAAIGGILGILFAPDKGSETRKKIAGKADDLTDSLKETFNSFVKESKNQFETEKSKVKGFVENV